MQKLLSYFREFKLAGIASGLEERISYAKLNKLSYQEFLELLCEDERDNRRDNSYKRRKAASKLPGNKRLEDFDFNYQPSIDRNQIYELGMCNTSSEINPKLPTVFT